MARSVYLSLVVVVGLMGSLSHAVTYTNGINESSWAASTSVFECRLQHSVPYYGDAVFRTRAGEASGFHLQARSSRFQAGSAQVLAKTPVWKPSLVEMSLGVVPVKRGRRPMWLGTKDAEKMLSELNKGMDIEFVKDAWYEPQEQPTMRLAMTTIGFRKEYRKYLNCLTGLLPANFHQMKRTALYFEPGVPEESEKLNRDIKRKLDNILMLVKHDSKIRVFYIDGHASAPGDRAENLALSKRRAELIAEYLKRRGVPEDWLNVRWHGERYPVASNATVGGRSKNRRVTIRLERVEEVDVLPLAAN